MQRVAHSLLPLAHGYNARDPKLRLLVDSTVSGIGEVEPEEPMLLTYSTDTRPIGTPRLGSES